MTTRLIVFFLLTHFVFGCHNSKDSRTTEVSKWPIKNNIVSSPADSLASILMEIQNIPGSLTGEKEIKTAWNKQRGEFIYDSPYEYHCGDSLYYEVLNSGIEILPLLVKNLSNQSLTKVKHNCLERYLTVSQLTILLIIQSSTDAYRLVNQGNQWCVLEEPNCDFGYAAGFFYFLLEHEERIKLDLTNWYNRNHKYFVEGDEENYSYGCERTRIKFDLIDVKSQEVLVGHELVDNIKSIERLPNIKEYEKNETQKTSFRIYCGDSIHTKIVKQGKLVIPFLIEKVRDSSPSKISTHCRTDTITVGTLSAVILFDLVEQSYTHLIHELDWEKTDNACDFGLTNGMLHYLTYERDSAYQNLKSWYQNNQELLDTLQLLDRKICIEDQEFFRALRERS